MSEQGGSRRTEVTNILTSIHTDDGTSEEQPESDNLGDRSRYGPRGSWAGREPAG